MNAMNAGRTSNLHEGRDVALLWLVALLGPVVWLVQLQVNYLLTYWVCETGARFVYPVVGLLALAILFWGGLLARRLRRKGETEQSPDAAGRVRLMTAAGIGGTAFFALVILATTIPGLVPGGCP